MNNSKTQLIAFQSIARREFTRIFRIWTQTLLPPAITQSLYFAIFGTLIGSQVKDINGVSYVAFLVPGLVMMTIISNSYSNVVSSFFGAKFQGSLEELLVSPVSKLTIILGYCAGGITRGLMTGLVVFLISLFFVQPKVENIFIVLLFAFLTALIFSLMGMLNGIFAKKFDHVSIVPTFILTPLIYLGGVFYSIKDLPEVFQNISRLNPILYMINGFRYGFYHISDVSVAASLSILTAFTLALFTANYYILIKGIGIKD
jgi:ABC-2 type transport system permease protein